jgi:lysophospholipase L1-like esterase
MAALGGDITRRPPSAQDDETAGYNPGDLWVTPAEQRIWLNRHNAPGRAVWQPVAQAHGHPVQAIGGPPPRAVYATAKLHEAYTGPLLQVVHPVSGHRRDIGALPSGGIDRNAMWSLLDGATHLQISAVFDQMGSGDHATQEAPENRPVITPLALLGNSVPIVFDGVLEGRRITKELNLPASLRLDSRSHAQLAVASFRAFSNSTRISTLFGAANLGWGSTASADSFMVAFGNHVVLPQSRVPTTPFVAGYSAAGTGTGAKTVIWLDNAAAERGSPPNIPLSGGTIGGHGIELSALLIYNQALSQAAMPAANAALNQYFGLAPQIRDRIWCEGDSLTAGYGAALDQNYPRQLAALLRKPARIYNTGAFGQTAARRAAYITEKAPLFFQPGASNILVLWVGTNDLSRPNPSAREIYQSLSQAISAARDTGFKTVLVTIPPRKSFATGGEVPGQQETERQSLNTLILENSAGAGAIADVAGDPVIGSFESTLNRDFYVDTIHFTSLGFAHVASVIAGQVNRLLA